LRSVDHSVAQEDGVAQGFHRQSMLCQTWDVIEVRHRAERQDELVVGHFVRRRQMAVPDAHLPLREVDRFDVGDGHSGVSQHLPQRLDNVGHGHVGTGDFVQHRREENEILARH
jgi:hypothetical protein